MENLFLEFGEYSFRDITREESAKVANSFRIN
jgi:hypothetical protein